MNAKKKLSQYDVLVVDDDPAILNLLTHLLEIGRYQVRSASDVNQALLMVLDHCPDVVIASRTMTELDGLELCRRIRQLHEQKLLPHYTYILILGEHVNKRSTIEALQAGADDFVVKDVTSLMEFRMEVQVRLDIAWRLRKLETDLDLAAKYDALTGLHNRLSFFDSAQIIWERSIRHKLPLAAVMMDCDMFKRINDVYGHTAGDMVLRTFADALRSCSRTSDLICRYGGEEFCAILPGCNEEVAWEWAERVRRLAETIPVKYNGNEISFTVSFGITERAESAELLEDLINRADHGLLNAKNSGRNQCIRYSNILEGEAGKKIDNHYIGNVTAKDVMSPIPFTIHPNDLIALVVLWLIETQFEILPVTDFDGKLIGSIAEKDIIPLVGQKEYWGSPIKKWINTSVPHYPASTPIRIIIDFLCRTANRHVMIVDEGKLVGYICSHSLLHWLIKRWQTVKGNVEILPDVKILPDQEG